MEDLVNYLRQQVPLTAQMDIRPGMADESTFSLQAPLAPNINDKGTAFGGSLATLCTLAGWVTISAICRELDCEVDIVIAKSEVRYLRPVHEDPVVATAFRPDAERVDLFSSELMSSGWATLDIGAVVQDDAKDAVRFVGKYGARLE